MEKCLRCTWCLRRSVFRRLSLHRCTVSVSAAWWPLNQYSEEGAGCEHRWTKRPRGARRIYSLHKGIFERKITFLPISTINWQSSLHVARQCNSEQINFIYFLHVKFLGRFGESIVSAIKRRKPVLLGPIYIASPSKSIGPKGVGFYLRKLIVRYPKRNLK